MPDTIRYQPQTGAGSSAEYPGYDISREKVGGRTDYTKPPGQQPVTKSRTSTKTSNEPIVVEYPDNWPGPEAGKTIEYERKADGSQGKVLRTAPTGGSFDVPKAKPGDKPIGDVITVGQYDGSPTKIDSVGNVIVGGRIVRGPSTDGMTAGRRGDIIPVFDTRDGQIVYRPDNTLGMSYDKAIEGQKKLMADFEKNNVKLAGDTYMPKDMFKELDKKYQTIGRNKGYDAMVNALLDDGYEVKSNGKTLTRGKRVIAASGGKVENDFRVDLPLNKEQSKLKELYDRQQGIASMPVAQRMKTTFVKSAKDFWGKDPVVIKDGDKYIPLEIKGGTAAALGGPQSAGAIVNILKGAAALGAAYFTKEAVASVKSAVEDYKKEHGTLPTAANLVMVDTATNTAVGISELPKDKKALTLTTPMLPSELIELRTPMQKAGITTMSTPMTADTGVEMITPMTPDKGLLILDPRVTDKADADDYLLKAAAVTDASNRLTSTAKAINWDSLIADSKDLNNLEITSSLERAYENLRRGSPLDYNNQELTSSLDAMYRRSKVDPVDMANQDPESAFARYQTMRTKGLKVEDFEAALEDYRLKLALLAEAHKSYVASLNPTPVTGTMNQNALYTLAGYKLANEIMTNPKLTNEQKTELLNQVSTQLSQELSTATTPSTATMPATATTPATAASTATSTDAATQATEATGPAELTTPATAAATRPVTGTRAAERLATRTAPLGGLIPVKPPDDDETDKGKKQKKVKVPPGSIAWEQGTLKGGEVVHFIPPPYERKITMVGKYPEGYEDRGNTPRVTIQTIGGPAKRNVTVRISPIMEADVKANERKITFRNTKRTAGRPRGKKPQDIGAGVVRDRRGQHIRLT